MHKAVEILNKNKLLICVLILALSIPVAASLSSSDNNSTYNKICFADPGNKNNTITFYPDSSRSDIDGNFYITQAAGRSIGGTYIESPVSYEITYTRTGYGVTFEKVPNGIKFEDINNNIETWNRI
jgi:hypothetical protein